MCTLWRCIPGTAPIPIPRPPPPPPLARAGLRPLPLQPLPGGGLCRGQHAAGGSRRLCAIPGGAAARAVSRWQPGGRGRRSTADCLCLGGQMLARAVGMPPQRARLTHPHSLPPPPARPPARQLRLPPALPQPAHRAAGGGAGRWAARAAAAARPQPSQRQLCSGGGLPGKVELFCVLRGIDVFL